MKQIDLISNSGLTKTTVQVNEGREALWAAALGVDSLDNAFDMTPAATAIPMLDAAIAKFQQDPESLRPLLAADDNLGLRGNRAAFLGLRKHLVQFGGTISGAFTDELPDQA